MERLLFPFAVLVIALLLVPFELSDWQWAVGAGVLLFVWGYLWGEEELLDVQTGFVALGFAAVAAVLAWAVARYDTLGRNAFVAWLASLRYAKHLPVLAIALASFGGSIVLVWLVRRLRGEERRGRF